MTIIAIVNLSGNTGKTTLAKHLFAPLLNARRISIEDVNTGDGEPDLQIAAKQFDTLAADLNVADEDENIVIDIGASNAKSMFEKMIKLSTTRKSVDYWVIPVVTANKQQTDSLVTMKKLNEIGIPFNQIVMLLNNVDGENLDSIEHDFTRIFGARELGVFVANGTVLQSEVFEMLKGSNETVFDLKQNRPTKAEFDAKKKEIRASGDMSALRALGVRQVLLDLADDAANNLRSVMGTMPAGMQPVAQEQPVQANPVQKSKKA
jgi:hypothetical protein